MMKYNALVCIFYIFLVISTHGHVYGIRLQLQETEKTKQIQQPSSNRMSLSQEFENEFIELQARSKAEQRMLAKEKEKLLAEVSTDIENKVEVKELTILAIISLAAAGVAVVSNMADYIWKFISKKISDYNERIYKRDLDLLQANMCTAITRTENEFLRQMDAFLDDKWPVARGGDGGSDGGSDAGVKVKDILCASDSKLCKMFKRMKVKVRISVAAMCGSSSLPELSPGAGQVTDPAALATEWAGRIEELKTAANELIIKPAAYVEHLGNSLEWWDSHSAILRSADGIGSIRIEGVTVDLSSPASILSTPLVSVGMSIASICYSLYQISNSVTSIVRTTHRFYIDKQEMVERYELKTLDMIRPVCKFFASIMINLAYMMVPGEAASCAPSGSVFIEMRKSSALGNGPSCCGGDRKGGDKPEKLPRRASREERRLIVSPPCVPCNPITRSSPSLPSPSSSSSSRRSSLAAAAAAASAPKSRCQAFFDVEKQFVDAQCDKITGWNVTEATLPNQLAGLIPKSEPQILYRVVAIAATQSCASLSPGRYSEVTLLNGTAPSLSGYYTAKPHKGGSLVPVRLCKSFDPASSIDGKVISGVDAHAFEKRDSEFDLCFGARPGKVGRETDESAVSCSLLEEKGFVREVTSVPICTDHMFYKVTSLHIHYSHKYDAPALRDVHIALASDTPPNAIKLSRGGVYTLSGSKVQYKRRVNFNNCDDYAAAYFFVEEFDYNIYHSELLF